MYYMKKGEGKRKVLFESEFCKIWTPDLTNWTFWLTFHTSASLNTVWKVQHICAKMFSQWKQTKRVIRFSLLTWPTNFKGTVQAIKYITWWWFSQTLMLNQYKFLFQKKNQLNIAKCPALGQHLKLLGHIPHPLKTSSAAPFEISL